MRELIILSLPDQEFNITLAGTRCHFRFRYNTVSDRWSFDLKINDEFLAQGRRVVNGIDILDGFGIGTAICVSVVSPEAVPNRENLPNRMTRILHLTDAEYGDI